MRVSEEVAAKPLVTPDGRPDHRAKWRRFVPGAVKRRLRSLQAYPDTLRLTADVRSFTTFRLIEDPGAAWPERATAHVRYRALGGAGLALRPGTADVYLPRDTFFKRHHLPPEEINPASAQLIFDLGANIGFTVAHIATACPDARIVGVELDAENAALCRHNVEPWRERCEVVQAAVWTSDGRIEYRRDPGDEQGYRVSAHGARQLVEAPALSLDTLVREHAVGQPVDYVKMDIEGAEAQVLKQRTEWAERVRAIKVEVHPPYTVEQCTADLRALGFTTRPIPKRRGGVTGLRV